MNVSIPNLINRLQFQFDAPVSLLCTTFALLSTSTAIYQAFVAFLPMVCFCLDCDDMMAQVAQWNASLLCFSIFSIKSHLPLQSVRTAQEASYPGRACIVALVALKPCLWNSGLLWTTVLQVCVYLGLAVGQGWVCCLTVRPDCVCSGS